MTPTSSLRTGISILDNTEILVPGKLISIVGSPGAGATALAMGIISRAYKGNTVLVNNLEESNNGMIRRVLVADGAIPSNFMRQSTRICDEDMAKVELALVEIEKAPLHFIRAYDLDVLEKSISELKPRLVVIDLLNMYSQPTGWTGTRGEYLALISNRLAQMARDHKTCLLLLETTGRTGAPGAYPNCFSSEAADDVLFLKREGERMFLSVEKSKHGTTGSQEIFMDGTTRTFRDSAMEVAAAALKVSPYHQPLPPLLLKTGFDRIDEKCILDPGQLIVLAGHVGVGTTSLAVSLVANAYKTGNVLVNSEMSGNEVLRRVLARDADIPMADLRRPWLMSDQAMAKTEEGLERLPSAAITCLNTYDLDLLEKAIKEARPALVVVDAVNQFPTRPGWRGTRTEWLTLVSAELARMTRHYKMVLVLVSNLGRADGESTSLRDAGGIQENADSVWILTRNGAKASLKITKNRSGGSYIEQEIEFDESTRSYRNPVNQA